MTPAPSHFSPQEVVTYYCTPVKQPTSRTNSTIIIIHREENHGTISSLSSTIIIMMAKKEGNCTCACGKVSIKIEMPYSSYGIAKQTCAYCQCNDCRNFAIALQSYRRTMMACRRRRGGDDDDDDTSPALNLLLTTDQQEKQAEVLDPSTNATLMTQFFKSDLISIDGGDEYLNACQLQPGSVATRYYTICCGTPFMLWYHSLPFVILFQKHLTTTGGKNKLPHIDPMVVVNHASAPVDSAPTPDGVMVREGLGAPVFIFRLIWRLLWGVLLGKGKVTPSVAKIVSQITPVIGIDAIGKKGN